MVELILIKTLHLNLESFNSELIKEKVCSEDRLRTLNRIAIEQMRVLIDSRSIKKIGIY